MLVSFNHSGGAVYTSLAHMLLFHPAKDGRCYQGVEHVVTVGTAAAAAMRTKRGTPYPTSYSPLPIMVTSMDPGGMLRRGHIHTYV